MIKQKSTPFRQQGSALLEALIAILIFSIGVLAVVGLQAAMMRETTAANYRAVAGALSTELVGRMWSDPSNLSSYAMTMSNTTVAYAPANAWLAKVRSTLPAGQASVTVNSGNVSITLAWQHQNEAPHRYVIDTAIQP